MFLECLVPHLAAQYLGVSHHLCPGNPYSWLLHFSLCLLLNQSPPCSILTSGNSTGSNSNPVKFQNSLRTNTKFYLCLAHIFCFFSLSTLLHTVLFACPTINLLFLQRVLSHPLTQKHSISVNPTQRCVPICTHCVCLIGSQASFYFKGNCRR